MAAPAAVERQGPMTDLRVIEMGQLIAGPFCGQLFADFGAEVIKIEAPREGDPMRHWGRKADGESLWFPVVGRNKMSVEIDARVAEGQDLIRKLVSSADVLIENFRPGTMERWGLDYTVLSAINPGLVMVRISGYGQTGPYAEKAGFGAIGEALGGLRYIVGDPGAPPSRMGISIGDTLAATFAYIGALMALHARERSGRGQMVDSAIYEAVLAVTESLVTEYDKIGYVRERTGAVLPNVAPSNVYPTADGAILLIAANHNKVFARLTKAMGRPDLLTDERFSTHDGRGANYVALDEIIAEWTSGLNLKDAIGLLDAHGVPQGQVFRAAEMLSDEHFRARSAIVDVMHHRLGGLKMQNVFPRLSDTPGRVASAGPALGAHNHYVLRDVLGLGPAESDELARRGVTGAIGSPR